MKRLTVLLLIAAFIMTSCSPKAEDVVVSAEQDETAVDNIEAFGVIKGRNIVNLTLNFTAAVEKVNVTQGQKVKKDDSIITLDLEPLHRQIEEKKIELASLRIEEEALKSEMEKEWEHTPDAQELATSKKYAELSYDDAVKERDLHKSLLESGGISRYEFSGYEKTVQLKEKELEEILLKENRARYLFQESKAEIQNKLLSVQNKIKGMDEAIKSLRKRTESSFIIGNNIISDMENALVYTIDCVAGDMLTEGKKAASLLDMDSLYVEANVNEEFIKDVSIGSEVLIIPEADKNREYRGKVSAISQGAYNINGQTSIPVHIEIEDMDDFLRPNFNVDVKIIKD